MKKKIKPVAVSVARRYLDLFTPSPFWAKIDRVHWPRTSWTNEFDLAQALSEKYKRVVGFRRFVYNEKKQRVYLDAGFVFFRGRFFNGEDAIKIDEVKTDMGPVAVDKIKNGLVKKIIDLPYRKDCPLVYLMLPQDKFISRGE